MSAAEPRRRTQSIFELPRGFFDSCRILSSSEVLCGLHSLPSPSPAELPPPETSAGEAECEEVEARRDAALTLRLTCNACRAEFHSLQDQRAHFKSDLHRLNVKLKTSGKNIIKEEDFDELDSDSLFDRLDVSSISGSEDEVEKECFTDSNMLRKNGEEVKQKLYFQVESGEIASIWKCFLLSESEDLALENGKSNNLQSIRHVSYGEEELMVRLNYLTYEPRDRTCLRTVLLLSGGHFAGCVFDGNSIIAHKTFHRYVVRAKAGKKQSSKDASGKAAHSAGSSLRRHNEAALRKEIQELLVSWVPYINSSLCIFIYAPSKNRQLLFDGEKASSSISDNIVRSIPFTVRRPTLKEAKRLYGLLTTVNYEILEKAAEGDHPAYIGGETLDKYELDKKAQLEKIPDTTKSSQSESAENSDTIRQSESENCSVNNNVSTPLHEAAKSGNAHLTMELLENGLNPCMKDERGRTPYMLANEKEVRNTFRRFMAINLDKWDWHAASVPSPLTKEMEDSQAAKQAEKDAKRKAKAKELKKLRKAKEKAQLEVRASETQNAPVVDPKGRMIPPRSIPALSLPSQQPESSSRVILSKEEQERRTLAAEREKRAAAAERRMAALGTCSGSRVESAPTGATRTESSDVVCSCCNASLAGKIPFHRYHYKYCSTSCMYVHKEVLEDM